DGVVEVTDEFVEALQHFAEGLLLDRRDRSVDTQNMVDIRAGPLARKHVLIPTTCDPAPVASGHATNRLRALVDDLERVMQIVEIAVESVEDLFQRIERRLLLARLVRRKHRLRDPRRVCDLVLPLALPITEPTEGST